MAALGRWLAGLRQAAPPPAVATKPIAAPLSPPLPPLPAGPRGKVGQQSRAWRNRNPGNLRPPSRWTPAGVIATDTAPGGPFLVHSSEEAGWQNLATRILQIHAGGTRTVRGIIGIWAPPAENDTNVYIRGVAAALGVGPDDPIDVRRYAVMDALADAIRRHEGMGSDPAWPQAAQDAGFAAAGVLR